jgi:hypothetical protein
MKISFDYKKGCKKFCHAFVPPGLSFALQGKQSSASLVQASYGKIHISNKPKLMSY